MRIGANLSAHHRFLTLAGQEPAIQLDGEVSPRADTRYWVAGSPPGHGERWGYLGAYAHLRTMTDLF
jgi:hypothetical protein